MDRLVRFLPWRHGPAAQVRSRPIRGRASVIAAALLVSGCAHKLPEPAGSQAEPHVSWAIGAGTSSGDELHVCQSSPRSVCELGASRPGRPVRSSIHLHLHAGDAGAVFDGEMRATFLADPAGGSAKIHNVVLAKREASTGLTGIIVDKPGTYEFSYTVVARGVGIDKTFEDRVGVFIR